VELLHAIRQRRSIRSFQPVEVPLESLEALVNLARVAPSAANRQPLEYLAIRSREGCKKVFPLLRWASYIYPRGNPGPGHEPSAYIVVLVKRSWESPYVAYDVGAAVQSILLGALEMDLASCWLASVDKEELRAAFSIPQELGIDSVVALGRSDQQSLLVEMEENESVRYYLKNKKMHVPKRKLEHIFHGEGDWK